MNCGCEIVTGVFIYDVMVYESVQNLFFYKNFLINKWRHLFTTFFLLELFKKFTKHLKFSIVNIIAKNPSKVSFSFFQFSVTTKNKEATLPFKLFNAWDEKAHQILFSPTRPKKESWKNSVDWKNFRVPSLFHPQNK